MAVAVLAYSLAFALSGLGGFDGAGLIPGVVHTAGDGLNVGFLVLAGFLAAGTLTDGLTQSQRRPRRPGSKRRRFGYSMASVLPFLALLYLAFLAPTVQWPVALMIVAFTAVPVVVLAIRSAQQARLAGVHRPEPALSGLLSPTDRAVTVILGLWLGAIGMLTGTPFGVAGIVTAAAFFLAILATRTTRVGLDRLTEDWGRTQWAAFGCTYLLMLGLSVVLSRTTWDLGLVSTVGGILIAAPLVVAAFRPAPIWAV
ncbi:MULTISPECIES: hypothetical protein [unclassified Cryobacterium]|nr:MULTISPECIES: hypothetical protein [unclassified Cryobacterium]TFC59495.1 hypothetical protein E3O68_00935 [Cryobacterium sp. TMB3-1-2]TFC67291.1 hypothetical protein E3T21_17630 [Cryobacterium sp. TMB3-15]TFC73196.1 hypothetical protein E3T22_16425 [Cryobacterium sp. TMB3-10]TFD46084.1 hypothetical protein E3T58_01060 [Cryobacterium sp. TMB3-12]